MTQRRHGTHLVVRLHGEIDFDNVAQVAAFLRAAVTAYGPRLVVDVTGVAFTDTTGLGLLVRLVAELYDEGGDLALVASAGCPALRKLGRMNLTDLFRVFDSVPAAASLPLTG
ncbi:STAS domain-containing protein [Nonomuraea sp. NPDC049152]|uniref:STAS domain-containing protein n=1 Tax=Nonomuraea sp. NPDC049152 TaxID=3154350 RepID=UPI0033F7ECC7